MAAVLDDSDHDALARIPGPVDVLAIVEDWCPDVVANLPILARAADHSDRLHLHVVSGRGAQILLETVWNRDLSGYDPDGPLPDVDPDPTAPLVIQGRARIHGNAQATVDEWRAIAEANNYSLRDLAIHVFAQTELVGTAQQVADRIDDFVQNDGADGFILGSHLTPTGLDEFVDKVVPLLQERGSLRAEYDGTTLRDNLGIAKASEPQGLGATG